MSTKKETNETPAITNTTCGLKFTDWEHVKREFKTGGITYQGIIFTDMNEYVSILAAKTGKSETEVLKGICMGYQALQMTRVAQAIVNSDKEDLEEGDVIMVSTLYGSKKSKWGALSPFIPAAKAAIVSKYDLDHFKSMEDEDILKVARQVKTIQEANTLDI